MRIIMDYIVEHPLIIFLILGITEFVVGPIIYLLLTKENKQ